MAKKARSSDPENFETALYLPVKRFLEAQGFSVKGEICGCDLVAVRGDEPPLVVIGELKLNFNLELLLQGVDRTAACDEIWLAVRSSTRGRENDSRVHKLCRLLGFGLLGVSARGQVNVFIEPAPWQPRRNNKRRVKILREHTRRIGDPVAGGSTKMPLMTAYRQAALACAAALMEGPQSTRALKADVPDAPKILLDNVYGWFERVERGIYALTGDGRAALLRWPQTVAPRRHPSTPAAPAVSG